MLSGTAPNGHRTTGVQATERTTSTGTAPRKAVTPWPPQLPPGSTRVAATPPGRPTDATGQPRGRRRPPGPEPAPVADRMEDRDIDQGRATARDAPWKLPDASPVTARPRSGDPPTPTVHAPATSHQIERAAVGTRWCTGVDMI